MSEYTSTLSGFQKAMLWSLTGPATEESVQAYADATCAPGFYQIMNGNRIELEDWKKGIAEWRGKTSDYKAEVQQFLRDGDQLAARMTGSIKVNDMDMAFESSIFAKVDESGKMEWLIERAVWGPAGEAPTYGEGLKGETMQ